MRNEIRTIYRCATRSIATLAVVAFGLNVTNAQTTLMSESFETDGEGSRYTSNTYSFCSGSANPDYFLRTNSNPVTPPGCAVGFTDALTNLQGSYFWASEDIRSSGPVVGAQPPGDITFNTVNISGYTNLNVSLYLATSSNNNARWETADSINIQVRNDNGAWRTVGRFMGDNAFGGRLKIDANLNGVIDGGETTICDQLNFTKYTFAFAGSGCAIQVKLDFDQIGGTEELGIDLIELTGTSGGAGPSITTSGTLSAFSACSGSASAAQSFTVSGSNLTANLVVTAPTGFEVSTSAVGSYSSSLSFTPSSGTVGSTSVFVRLAASASGSPSGNVACTSQCATTKNVAASGTMGSTPSTPTITPGGSTTFCTGGSVTLTSSSATGNQWRLNGNPIGGATDQTYSAGASGTFTVVVTQSGCSSAASSGTTVTVNTTPATPTVTPGGTTTFCTGGSVSLTSSSASGNQWYLNGGTIGGATDQSYTATSSDTYTVVVTSSGCSSAASSGTVVTVNTTPSQPTITPTGPTTFCSGGSVFLISSAGSGNQWYLDNNLINSATAQFYSASASGDYTVIATNSGCSSSASSAVTVTVNATTIDSDPVSSSICAYNSGTYSVTSGNATGYQWQVSIDGGGVFNNISDGGVHSGTGTATLTVTQPPFSMSGYQYRCIASGSCAPNATSAAATMTVIGPQFTQNPTDASICENGNATFSVTVTSPGFPSYQWFYSDDNGSNYNPVPSAAPYSGESTNTLDITGATLGMDGYLYRVKLGNGVCAILSPPSSSGELSVAAYSTWYQDTDNDGYGNSVITQSACSCGATIFKNRLN